MSATLPAEVYCCVAAALLHGSRRPAWLRTNQIAKPLPKPPAKPLALGPASFFKSPRGGGEQRYRHDSARRTAPEGDRMPRPRRPPLHPRLAEYRHDRNLTQEQVAEAIDITAEMVRRHEKGLSRPAARSRRRYSALYHASEAALGLAAGPAPVDTSAVGVEQLLAEITESSTSNEAVELLDHGTATLAQLHTRTPARRVLQQVLQLRANAHALTQGPVRLGQARELYRIESELLAHSCLLLSDLNRYDEAYRHGMAGLVFAAEAGSNDAIIRSALAKTLRWEERLVESADMAHAGYRASPMTPIRLQLASYEANAAALLGDATRARNVLRRVEDDAGACTDDDGTSAWSFPRPRQAIFALSVATENGDPKGALHAAAMADESWAAGEPVVKANWAQIRIGAGIAHLDRGDLEPAVAEVTPVLDLPPELRVATVTAYTTRMARRLRHRRFRGNASAGELLNELRVFTLEALPLEGA